MDNEDINARYAVDAGRTLSGEFYGDNIALVRLMPVLHDVIATSKRLDALKKNLFYGKALEMPSHPGLPTVGRLGLIEEQVLHGIIGAITEAGELAEVAVKIIRGEAVDFVHLREEWGDILWYVAVGLSANGETITDAQRSNIAKLAKRYPNKFTLYAAENRDLFAERAALEGPFVQASDMAEAELNTGIWPVENGEADTVLPDDWLKQAQADDAKPGDGECEACQ